MEKTRADSGRQHFKSLLALVLSAGTMVGCGTYERDSASNRFPAQSQPLENQPAAAGPARSRYPAQELASAADEESNSRARIYSTADVLLTPTSSNSATR